jgi:hypothetical protein
MIANILSLPVAATLRYEILDEQAEQGRFVVTPGPNGIPTARAVYFIVDEECGQPHLQKIGMTDKAQGLSGRMNDYRDISGGDDDTPNLYYNMMTGPLQGRSFKVYYRSFELRGVAEVFGQEVEILYTAHRFIENHLRRRIRQLRQGNMETYPLWLETGMYQP